MRRPEDEDFVPRQFLPAAALIADYAGVSFVTDNGAALSPSPP